MYELEFLVEQETLSVIQWVMRTIVAFLFLLVASKFLGERAISQLSLIDFSIALLIGNILARPLSDSESGMRGPFITTTVLIILYLIAIRLSLKWGLFRKWSEPSPFSLVKNGEIIYKNLRQAHIAIDHLLSSARKQQINDISTVALAQWEPDGNISFFLSTQSQTVTTADLKLVTEPFAFTEIIIKEGKIVNSALQVLNKDIRWLHAELESLQAPLHTILLATLTTNDVLKLYYYTEYEQNLCK